MPPEQVERLIEIAQGIGIVSGIGFGALCLFALIVRAKRRFDDRYRDFWNAIGRLFAGNDS